MPILFADLASRPLNTATCCPVPDSTVESPTWTAATLVPESHVSSFIDDVADECYASTFASALNVPYSDRSHLTYLRDLFFGLSDTVPHLLVPSLSLLHNALASHGIEYNDLSMEECRLVYASHMLTGACMLGDGTPNSPACVILSQHYSTAHTLVTDIADVVMSYMVANGQDSLRTRYLLSKIFAPHVCDGMSLSLEEFLRYLLYWRQASVSETLVNLIQSLDSKPLPVLLSLCNSHGLVIPRKPKLDGLRQLLSEHLISGLCTHLAPDSHSVSAYESPSYPDTSYQTQLLRVLQQKGSLRVLRRVLSILRLPFDPKASVRQLRSELQRHISRLDKGKDGAVRDAVGMWDDKHNRDFFNAQRRRFRAESEIRRVRERDEKVHELRANWPKIPPRDLKEKLVRLFQERTSSEALAQFTCASCGEEHFHSHEHLLSMSEIDLSLLRPMSDLEGVPRPSDTHRWGGALLDPAGIVGVDTGEPMISLCKSCKGALKNNKTPALSMANMNYMGPVPEELSSLTIIEESMVALCRTKCIVVQLQDDSETQSKKTVKQRGTIGHMIVYPQRPGAVAEMLPPSIEEITSPVCVIFIGA